MTKALVIAVLAVSANVSAAPWERPRLVVVLSLDGFRYDFLTRLYDYLHSGRGAGECWWYHGL